MDEANDKTKTSLFKDGEQPEGWVRGKWASEKETSGWDKFRKEHKRYMDISNGTERKRIFFNDISEVVIPEGWNKISSKSV